MEQIKDWPKERIKPTWEQALREAAYNSPSGERIVFLYEDVRRVITKKTAAFNFPDANGTLVQDNGNTGRQFPLRLIFSGDDHHTQADKFDGMVREIGVGILEHPKYGTFSVVPFGNITQRDSLKTAANQSVFETTFWESIPDTYPLPQVDRAAAVVKAVEEFNVANADEFAKKIDISTAAKKASLKSRFTVFLGEANTKLRALSEKQQDVRAKFEAVYDSINTTIDTLVGAPLTLASQTAQLIQSPALALSAVRGRLDQYLSIAQTLLTTSAASASNNDFRLDDNLVMNYVAGAVESVVNAQFSTKGEALQAATDILGMLSDVSDWRDTQLTALAEVDTGAPYQKLQEAVALTAGFLVEISFTLKLERTLIVDRDRTIIDLAAELYGEVDARLDFLIISNALTGSEIIELPRGRKIVYYL